MGSRVSDASSRHTEGHLGWFGGARAHVGPRDESVKLVFNICVCAHTTHE